MDWDALFTRPRNFADGAPADAWFGRIADILLNRTVLRLAGQTHRLIEIEVYYYGPGHEDPFAHRDPVQLHSGRWYFHKSRGQYRGGTFKGLDLSFGGGVAHAGVLFRGIEKPDDSVVDGPSLLVDHVLKATAFTSVAELDRHIGSRLAWDDSQPVALVTAVNSLERVILRTARVGLTWKWRRPKPSDPAAKFLLRPYRYLTEPRRTAKGKPHQVLALLAMGEPPERIRERTGCPLPTIERYAAEFEEGQQEDDFTPYYGKDWGARELARLHGLLLGK